MLARTRSSIFHSVVLLLGFAAAPAAQATAVVSGALDGVQLTPAVGLTSASLNASGVRGQFLSGTANAITGVVSDAVFASPSDQNIPPPPTWVESRISEVVTFTSGFGQTAYLDFSFAGTLPEEGFTGNSGLTSTFARLDLFAGLTRGGAALNRAGTGECTSDTQICLTGIAANVTGSLPFVISTQPISVGATLFAMSGEGVGSGYVDFASGNAIYLRTDASWTSQSGLFLSQAAPILPAIPEPATSLLMLVGALGLWLGRDSMRPKQR